jgi:hypothetical protein
VDLLINVKSVTCHLIQKENLKSMRNMLNIEGKVIVGNNDAKNMKRNHVIRQISCYRILVKPVC